MIEMHPSLPFFLAAALAFFLNPRLRSIVQLAVPLISFWMIQRLLAAGDQTVLLHFPAYTFTLLRLDSLALLFCYAFLIFGFLAHLYAIHAHEKETHIFANLYVGSSLGAVLAGDLVTLFIFWELMALTSAILIWNRQRKTSLPALFRYLLVHLTGGLFFFSGLLMKLFAGGGLLFQTLPLDTAGWMIFAGFAINAALVPVHSWLPDAYPEGTAHGSVYLSAFTTKVAVYAFARGFAGEEILIWLGAVAAVYGVIWALMENDMRRLLSYHIVCQIGYMVCGIGIGSDLGINAGTAHAIGNILFKGLLFMATGAILFRTGKTKLSDLGGFAHADRWILFFFMTGALAISGAPLLNGYVSKSLLLKAAEHAHLAWLEATLLLVAVGTFLSIALKLAYFAFWGEGSGGKNPERRLPLNMYLAMGATALTCFAIGVYPDLMYRFLPFPEHAHVYSADHVIHSVELLLGTVLTFALIVKHLHAKAVITLDLDWFYRKGARLFERAFCFPVNAGQVSIQQRWTEWIANADQRLKRWFKDQAIAPASNPLMMIMIACLLVGMLLLF